MKPWIIPTLFGLSAILLGIISLRLFTSSNETFPKLSVEISYLGWFPGKVLGTEEDRIYFRVVPLANSESLSMQIFRSGWAAKNIPTTEAQVLKHPLIITGPEGVLRIAGKIDSQDLISGSVVNVSLGENANWFLYPDQSAQNEKSTHISVEHLLASKAEHFNLELQISGHRHAIEKAAQESTRLDALVTEGKTIQLRAESRFSEKKSEIEFLQAQVAALEKSLAQLQASLNVSKSVTPRGRITTLARETLAREFRVINYKLSSEARKNDVQLLEQAARAKRALALQQQLASYEQSNLGRVPE